ncbi:hypothetical protein C7212DRAFT_58437, partial [Tuber magnatum]
PEVKSKFSKQLDYKRRLCRNNKELLGNYFDMYYEIVTQFAIKPQNMYNIDEIGFLMGLGALERMI